MGVRGLAWVAAGALAMTPGCPPTAPACDMVCPAARPAFEACLDEWGLEYGEAVGYTDGADYDNWCSTWVVEQRFLARTAEVPMEATDQLEERCHQVRDVLEEGDCAVYWGLWDDS